MFRKKSFTFIFALLSIFAVAGGVSFGQIQQETKAEKEQRKIREREAREKAKKDKEEQDRLAKERQNQALTGDQIVEILIFAFGGREGMAQIRKTEIERGKTTRYLPENKTEEISYEERVLRGENMEKDRWRLDQKSPTFDFAVIKSQTKIFGLLGETTFQPRQEIVRSFEAKLWHGIEALIRYRENGATLKLLGKDTKMGVEFNIIELTDKANRVTRFNISTKTYRVLSAEYEQALTEGGTSAKYVRKFYDYRVAQGTLVPFRSVLFENETQIEENNVLTVTYGIKLDETAFGEAPQS